MRPVCTRYNVMISTATYWTDTQHTFLPQLNQDPDSPSGAGLPLLRLVSGALIGPVAACASAIGPEGSGMGGNPPGGIPGPIGPTILGSIRGVGGEDIFVKMMPKPSIIACGQRQLLQV